MIPEANDEERARYNRVMDDAVLRVLEDLLCDRCLARYMEARRENRYFSYDDELCKRCLDRLFEQIDHAFGGSERGRQAGDAVGDRHSRRYHPRLYSWAAWDPVPHL